VARISRADSLILRDRRLLAAAPLFGPNYAKTDHWFGAVKLLFLLAIVVIPYPIRVWCFHVGTRFERVACRRVMNERLSPDFLRQMTHRYGIATMVQIAAIAVAIPAPCVAFFLLPQPKPRYEPGEEPSAQEKQ
jgi:hypothetical protein